MKTILGIIAFTLTFGLSAGLVGLLFGFPQTETETKKFNSAYKYKIKSLLKRDIRNGDLRDEQIYQLRNDGIESDSTIYREGYSNSINEYYLNSSSLDASNLPDDFRYAWKEHMDAWKVQTEYVKSLQSENYEEDADTAVRTYFDNSDEISRTWYQVLRIAQRYGVEIDSTYR